MKRNGKGIVWAGLGWMAAFVIWTMLIQTVDVRAVGPNGTKVGFAALNGWFHALTGVHWLTDIIGAALLSAGLFALYRGAVWRLDARREEGKANWNCTKNCRH